jgi:hypothetical protein
MRLLPDDPSPRLGPGGQTGIADAEPRTNERPAPSMRAFIIVRTKPRSPDGVPTLGNKHGCAILTSGLGGGCVPSPGSSGSVGRTRCARLRRRGRPGPGGAKPPAAHMALGGSVIAPRAHHRPAERFLRLARPRDLGARAPRLVPNRRMGTRTYGGVGGAAPRGSPYPDFCTCSARSSPGTDAQKGNAFVVATTDLCA